MAGIEQAVILAAGEGQRLRPFTVSKPKVMLAIANKPMLSYVIEAAAKNGIRDIVMVVGYKKEQVQDYFSSGEQFGVTIDYVVQKSQVGTGQALKLAQPALGHRFLVLPGDNIIEPATLAIIVRSPSAAVLLKRSENVSKYGVVSLEAGKVKRLAEKPREAESNLVSTGIYALGSDIFDFLKTEKDLPSAVQAMVATGISVDGVETEATWLDIVYPWDILTLNGAALLRVASSSAGVVEPGCVLKGPVSIGRGSNIRANSYLVGPLIIGEGCEIGPSACILPSTSIGDNVTIEPFGYISNSVVRAGARIGPSSSLHNTVIGSHTTLGSHFTARSGSSRINVDDESHRVTMGAMIGENCDIEDNVVVQPGVIIGNYSRVHALKTVSESTPDRSLLV